jgi:hypothetical protein
MAASHRLDAQIGGYLPTSMGEGTTGGFGGGPGGFLQRDIVKQKRRNNEGNERKRIASHLGAAHTGQYQANGGNERARVHRGLITGSNELRRLPLVLTASKRWVAYL